MKRNRVAPLLVALFALASVASAQPPSKFAGVYWVNHFDGNGGADGSNRLGYNLRESTVTGSKACGKMSDRSVCVPVSQLVADPRDWDAWPIVCNKTNQDRLDWALSEVLGPELPRPAIAAILADMKAAGLNTKLATGQQVREILVKWTQKRFPGFSCKDQAAKQTCLKSGREWKSGLQETGYPVAVCVQPGTDIATVQVIAYARFIASKS